MIRLESIPLADLRNLAVSDYPDHLLQRALPDALPPSFVAERSLRQLCSGLSEAWCSTFYIVRLADNSIVGSCGFKSEPLDQQVEIGYGVAPSARAQGIASAAVAELIRIATQLGSAKRLMARVNPDNLPSIHVVQKNGFLYEELIIDEDGEPLVNWIKHISADT